MEEKIKNIKEVVETNKKKSKSDRKLYKTLDELPLFLSIKDLADVLQISEPIAQRIAYSNGFPILDRGITGKRMLIPKFAFMDWAKENLSFKGKEKTTY